MNNRLVNKQKEKENAFGKTLSGLRKEEKRRSYNSIRF